LFYNYNVFGFRGEVLEYPYLFINLEKIESNSREIVKCCKKNGLNVIGVTKGCLGDPAVARAMLNGGVSGIGDSRILSLKKLRENGFNNLMMLRQPMREKVQDAVRYSDVCLISDIQVLPLLSKEAAKLNKIYGIILMVETGGLREGMLPEDLLKAVDKVLQLKNIRFLGIGSNACPLLYEQTKINFVPTSSDFQLLTELADSIKDKFGIKVEVISGGNSSVWKMVETGTVPDEINQLRIGEAILLGQETTSCEKIKGTFQDAFVLFAEVLEVREKKYPKGWLKQAIVALGRQDIGNEILKPCFNGEILRVSADHMVIDISKADKVVSAGDILSFIPGYYALQMAMTSPFVLKEYAQVSCDISERAR